MAPPKVGLSRTQPSNAPVAAHAWRAADALSLTLLLTVDAELGFYLGFRQEAQEWLAPWPNTSRCLAVEYQRLDDVRYA